MNPLIQGKSGTTQVMSRNAFSTNQGTNEDDSQSDPHPEAGIFRNQTMQMSGQNIAVTWWQEFRERVFAAVTWWQELQNGLVIAVTWWQEFTRKSHTAPQVHLRESRKRTVLLVNRNSAARIPLRRSRQTKFCWPSNSWQITTILRTFLITSTEFPNCQSHLPQRCPHLTGNLRNLSCLKIFSKRASKYTMSLLKMTESITFIVSWGGMRYKLLRTLMAQPEITREKF